jgi:hypothetical protein
VSEDRVPYFLRARVEPGPPQPEPTEEELLADEMTLLGERLVQLARIGNVGAQDLIKELTNRQGDDDERDEAFIRRAKQIVGSVSWPMPEGLE